MAEYMDPAMDAMEDAAGTAAEEAYTAALEGGADPSAAASAAIEAAGAVMTEMGAPPEMVDTMANAAQDGFDSAIGSGMSPMEAFDAAGQSVDTAFGDGPPQVVIWLLTQNGSPSTSKGQVVGWRPPMGPADMLQQRDQIWVGPAMDMPIRDPIMDLLITVVPARDQQTWVVTQLWDLLILVVILEWDPIWMVTLAGDMGPADMARTTVWDRPIYWRPWNGTNHGALIHYLVMQVQLVVIQQWALTCLQWIQWVAGPRR